MHKITPIILTIIVSNLLLIFPISIVRSETTTVFYSELDDGFLRKSGLNYTNVNNAINATYKSTNFTYIGQFIIGSDFYIARSFLFFDTSFNVTTGTLKISRATLSLYAYSDSGGPEFQIIAQKCETPHPHQPLEYSDYNCLHYSGNGGYFNHSDFWGAYNDIELNPAGITWINQSGMTKLCLRSSRDINQIEPTGSELVAFKTREAGLDEAPKLEVTWTIEENDNVPWYVPEEQESPLEETTEVVESILSKYGLYAILGVIILLIFGGIYVSISTKKTRRVPTGRVGKLRGPKGRIKLKKNKRRYA